MLSTAARRLVPTRSVERAYGRLPIAVPRSISNAYLRLTLGDDFDGYEHPPDPFAVHSVDPDRIEAFTGRPYPPYHGKAAQLGTVRGGDWDRTDAPPIVDDDYRERFELYRADRFSESVFYESLRAHFEDDVDWTNTPFVRRCLELAEAGEQSWRSITSKAELLERCAEIDELYERIRENGYRSQRDLGERSLLKATDEIVVDVARDGRLLFVNGRHRLAIAKLLDLECVPVGILVRHAEWMDARDAYARDGTVPDRPNRELTPDHPDLRDL